MRVSELLAESRLQLAGNTAGNLEADLLMRHVIGVDRAWLYANGDREVDDSSVRHFRDLVARRKSGEPIAYVTGVREFWSLPLRITPAVLIPRPDTERLVEVALQLISTQQPARVADLGTGSGAVALAIASERPACEVHATEIDPAALAIARSNGDALFPGRVAFHQGSWLEPLDGQFDMIVSNPPYIDGQDDHLELGDLRFEPVSALSPGPDGMSAIREIARESLAFLKDRGFLVFEHGFDQGAAARDFLKQLGYGEINTYQDLEKRDRVTCGRLRK